MERGNGLMKSDFTEEGFPCIHYGQIHTFYGMATYNTKSFCSVNLAKKLRKAKYGDLLIATTSEDVEACCKATVWLGEGEVAFSGDSYKFSHSQNPKYISYLFKTEAFAKQKRVCATGAKVVRVSGNSMEKFKFQIPPLSIQQQIVEILDTFTDSISNLQEELELREKQMEYYRENIMTSEKVWKTLGEIGTLIRGKRFCHRDAVENGIPCIHYGELYTYYGVSTDVTKSFVRDDLAAKLRFAKKGDVVIVGAGENDIDIGVGVAYYGVKQVAVHDACYTLSNHNMSPKFISYWLRTNTYHQQIRQYVSSGKICSISTEGLAKARIPAPSLTRQQEIVDILDTFESMIANIKEEIELRQKQYEYYREKLLTFERKGA